MEDTRPLADLLIGVSLLEALTKEWGKVRDAQDDVVHALTMKLPALERAKLMRSRLDRFIHLLVIAEHIEENEKEI